MIFITETRAIIEIVNVLNENSHGVMMVRESKSGPVRNRHARPQRLLTERLAATWLKGFTLTIQALRATWRMANWLSGDWTASITMALPDWEERPTIHEHERSWVFQFSFTSSFFVQKFPSTKVLMHDNFWPSCWLHRHQSHDQFMCRDKKATHFCKSFQ